ncbi:MAG TPA: PDZ domain-containing protein [Burkholderiales bacterium]|nr:PDZ domain-containing protein [Burkholderiales bacterium]
MPPSSRIDLMMARLIHYRIVPEQPEAHLFAATCTVDDPDPLGQRFALPAWTPGSYLIRDFARHIVDIRAQTGRRSVRLEHLDKHTWMAEPVRGPLSVTAHVYGADASVRGAYLDTLRGFVNGPALLLRALGREEHACELEILPPRGARYRTWRAATTLRRKRASASGFGTYGAADYDELIDHPIAMGPLSIASFQACGVPHQVAIAGRHDADLGRLCADLKVLCETHIRLFGEPAPMDRYAFLVTAVGEGYGGLEHRASTALLCSRDELPTPEMKAPTEGYRRFLGLASHEYFHTWNVKRIKPAAFVPYQLDRENYTRLLWAFEGITSYYDDLLLARSGLTSPQDYLELLGRNISSLLRSPGRSRQTVAESSFDAWIKYYRQDENSPNSQVSYYLKGSLIALCLDLTIRQRTRGRKSLDDVMRALWRGYGQTGIGLPEDGFEQLTDRVTGLRLRAFFDRALRSTEELPLKQALAAVGVQMHLRQAESSSDKGGKPGPAARQRASLGVRTAEDPGGAKLTHVLEQGAAQAAGLSPGDVIVAVDAMKVSAKALDQRLARYRPGTALTVHAFRGDELHQFKVELRSAPEDTCWLTTSDADRAAGNRRRAWLSG